MAMTLETKKKLGNAKKMVTTLISVFNEDGDKAFIPTQYEHMRHGWKCITGEETPSWATLKKYAKEAHLLKEQRSYIWHSDGSMLAEFAAFSLEGKECFYDVYYFGD